MKSLVAKSKKNTLASLDNRVLERSSVPLESDPFKARAFKISSKASDNFYFLSGKCLQILPHKGAATASD